MLKIWRIFLLALVGMLLTLTLIMSLTLFGIDRALYSTSFFARRLNESQVILSEERVHQALIGSFVNSMIKQTGQSVPFELRTYIAEAAKQTFTNTWLINEVENAVKTAQGILTGDTASLDFSLSLTSYKNNLEGMLLSQTRLGSQQISTGLRNIPAQVNIKEIIPAEDLKKWEGHLRSYNLYVNAIMYLVPAVFIALCFSLRKIRMGAITVGAAFITASMIEWEIMRYFSTHGGTIAARFLQQGETRYFRPVFQAGLVDISLFINPAVIMSLITGFTVIISGFIIEMVLKDERFRKKLQKRRTHRTITQIIEDERGADMNVKTKVFGTLPNGTEVTAVTLSNKNGVALTIINYGGAVNSLKVPDRNNQSGEISLGFDSLEGYLGENPYFGALIGRFGNRIADGRFELDGHTYNLACNDGPNHLHGGVNGFDKRCWEMASSKTAHTGEVKLNLVSPDGEEGYPGNLNVEVRYCLNNANELYITYRAETDKATPVNLTNHTYFNLKRTGRIDDHSILINADAYLPVNEKLIPTGEIAGVADTPFDFRTARSMAQNWDATGGYDHCFVLNGKGESLTNDNTHGKTLYLAADVQETATGRGMKVYTDLPGVQFYTGNFLTGIKGHAGDIHEEKTAFCLETQGFPDAVNHSNFPDAVLKPGDVYQTTTCYKFYTL